MCVEITRLVNACVVCETTELRVSEELCVVNIEKSSLFPHIVCVVLCRRSLPALAALCSFGVPNLHQPSACV
jgi:hypothetical protein